MGWIILIVVVLILIWIVSVYNGLISSRQKVENAWSQIDVQLQRRFDLIPNFVETVKGYMTHESETFEKIAKLRTSWANTSSVGEKAKLDGELSSTLKTIMAVSENYPELKASSNFSQLSKELTKIEDDIANSRKYYNGTVRILNNQIQMFPSNIIAKIFGFKQANMFEAKLEEKNNVNVEL